MTDSAPISRTDETVGGTLLAAQLTLSALCGVIVTVIWVAVSRGHNFWPRWVLLGLAFALALHVSVRWGLTRPAGRERNLAVQTAVSLSICWLLVGVWLMAGLGFFWPLFPILAFGAAYVVHATIITPRQGELTGRIDELARTRRGALDVQAAELRRIERDLHDGAQARLVALSMQLGRAEERLQDRPDAAELVHNARLEAVAAIRELRDLARGIAPPVLADRGLAPAVAALADRYGAAITVTTEIEERPPPVVETAAYFVVAEALTNAIKHAPGADVEITLTEAASTLLIEVRDSGPGLADPNGTGLTGMRQRVEALDGTFAVDSRPGAGTTITARLPCA